MPAFAGTVVKLWSEDYFFAAAFFLAPPFFLGAAFFFATAFFLAAMFNLHVGLVRAQYLQKSKLDCKRYVINF